MLAGMQDPFSGDDTQQPLGSMDLSVGPSMFETLGKQHSNIAPSVEEMEQHKEALQYGKKVALKDICVRTYDLRKPVDVKAYRADLKSLLLGVTLKTHAVMAKTPLQFVSDELGGTGYIVHMEWIEFALTEEHAVPGVSDGNKDSTNVV